MHLADDDAPQPVVARAEPVGGLRGAPARQPRARSPPQEAHELIAALTQAPEPAYIDAITALLLAGKDPRRILDTMQIAIADLILETGDGRNFSMPQHCFQYSNTLGWFFDTFDHPHRLKLLYVAGSFINQTAHWVRATPGQRQGRHARAAGQPRVDVGADEILSGSTRRRSAMKPEESVAWTRAYLDGGHDRAPLVRHPRARRAQARQRHRTTRRSRSASWTTTGTPGPRPRAAAARLRPAHRGAPEVRRHPRVLQALRGGLRRLAHERSQLQPHGPGVRGGSLSDLPPAARRGSRPPEPARLLGAHAATRTWCASLRDPRLIKEPIAAFVAARFGAGAARAWGCPCWTAIRPTTRACAASSARPSRPRVVEQLRPHIQQIVDGLLDRVRATGGMDLIEDFAYPAARHRHLRDARRAASRITSASRAGGSTSRAGWTPSCCRRTRTVAERSVARAPRARRLLPRAHRRAPRRSRATTC